MKNCIVIKRQLSVKKPFVSKTESLMTDIKSVFRTSVVQQIIESNMLSSVLAVCN